MKKLFRLIMFGAIIYVCCLYFYFKVPIKTDIVNYGLLEDYVNTTGYIIRQEKLIYSNVAGTLDKVAKEGQRVSKGAKVVTIYTKNVDSQIQNRIKDLNERISEIKSNQVGKNIFAQDLKKLDKFIGEKVNETINLSYNNRASELERLKNEINRLIDKKLKISGKNGIAENNLEILTKERDQYNDKLRSCKIDVFAEKPGVVLYNIDGLENILSPNNINEFNVSGIDALKNFESNEYEINDSQEIKPTQPVAKLVDNFQWYIAALVDESDINTSFEKGKRIKVRFIDMNDAVTDAIIYNISEKEDAKRLVVLALDKHIDLTYDFRKVNIDIIVESHSGFKVPKQAITVRNGKKCVCIIKKDSFTEFKEVNIVYNDNDYMIVEGDLQLYDEIIINPHNIEDSKLIR